MQEPRFPARPPLVDAGTRPPLEIFSRKSTFRKIATASAMAKVDFLKSGYI